MDFIWKQDRYPIDQKMNVLANVIKEDEDLQVVAFAGYTFQKESKQVKEGVIKPLAYWELLEWWEKNKNTYSQGLGNGLRYPATQEK